MIIWSGWGILVIVFAFFGFVAGGLIAALSGSWFGPATGALLGSLLGGAIVAYITAVVARRLARGGRELVDPKTGERVT